VSKLSHKTSLELLLDSMDVLMFRFLFFNTTKKVPFIIYITTTKRKFQDRNEENNYLVQRTSWCSDPWRVSIVSTASQNVALDPSLACKMATIVSVVPSKYLWTLKNELHEEFWKAQIWTYRGTKIQKLQAPCHIISHSTKPWGGVDHKRFGRESFGRDSGMTKQSWSGLEKTVAIPLVTVFWYNSASRPLQWMHNVWFSSL
jgi:hypothetical protein